VLEIPNYTLRLLKLTRAIKVRQFFGTEEKSKLQSA